MKGRKEEKVEERNWEMKWEMTDRNINEWLKKKSLNNEWMHEWKIERMEVQGLTENEKK